MCIGIRQRVQQSRIQTAHRLCKRGAADVPVESGLDALLARAGQCLFVPIRSLQYMAVLDAEEFIFVDSQNKAWVLVGDRRKAVIR